MMAFHLTCDIVAAIDYFSELLGSVKSVLQKLKL